MYSIYALCIYGISINQVNKLYENGLTLKDFEDQTDKISEIATHKPALVERISEILTSIKSEEREDNLYQLAVEGLSGQIITNLIDHNISYQDLNDLTLEKYNEMMGGQRKKVYEKITDAFEAVEKAKGRVTRRTIMKALHEMLDALSLNETLSIERIKDRLSSEYSLSIDLNVVISVIVELCATNDFIYDSTGVKRYFPKLMEYLGGEFKDKEVFIHRLQGKTFAQLAKEYGFSRQGISNIEKRVLKRMPVFEEDLKYREYFETFDVPQDLFCKLFDEPIEVYHYLNIKYKKGSQSLLEDIDNPRFTETQRKAILRHYNYFISKQGEIKEITKMSVFEDVIEKYALEAVTDADIVDKFNEYIIKNNFPEAFISEESTIRGLSDRCTNNIRGKGNTYRYYDFDVVSDDLLTKLRDLLSLDPGVYSMKKLFTENPELMDELDIRSEYELHNLYRILIEEDNVFYTRMPEFTIGKINKEDFLIGLFKEYSPIPLKAFVENVEEVYGLRKDSLTSYIIGYLNEYVHEDIIKTDYEELTDEDFHQLQLLLQEPIYTLEEAKKLVRSLGQNYDTKYINNMTLSKLGFQIRSNFVLSESYNSVDEYFRSKILSEDYFHNDHRPVNQTQSFNAVIYDLEKNFEIFKIEKDMYITYKKLASVGISMDDIMDYKRKLLAFLDGDSYRYFTLYSLREEGFEHPLDDLGFSDLFYERLIWAYEEFRAIQTSTGYILRMTNTNLSLREFLYDYISQKRVIKLEDLIDDLRDLYDIHLDTSKVIYLVKQTDAFYSDELYKFYIDKEDYFEEVYE